MTRDRTRRAYLIPQHIQRIPMQNISIRTEIGKAIRRGFASPSPALRIDYAQLELQIVARQLRDDGTLEPLP